MGVNKYLSSLNWKIRDLPVEYKAEIMTDYENHFKEGLLAGKTEDNIILELGDSDLIAKNILAEYYTEHPDAAKNTGDTSGPDGKAIGIALKISNLLFVLPFVFSAHLMVISLYIMDYAMLAAPVFLLVKLFFPSLPITVGFDTEKQWINVLFALGLAGTGYAINRRVKRYGAEFFHWVSGYYEKSFRFVKNRSR